MNTPQGAVQLLREDSNFNDFVDSLSDGLEESARKVVSDIMNRQRVSLLEESANVGPSVFTH